MAQFRSVSFWFVGLLVLVVAGFWQSYFGKFFRGLEFAHHFHATVMLAWVALLIVQPWLIRTKRHALHRLIGKFGLVVAVLVVISGAHVAVFGLGEGVDERGARGFYFGVFQAFYFALMAILAFATRRNHGLHARYMIATGLVFVIPSFGRFYFQILEPMGLPGLPLLTIQATPTALALVLVAWDRRHGGVRFPFLLAGGLWLGHIWVMSQIIHWDWWIAFSNQMV